MDVWISRCRKTVRCSYCSEDISNGEPMVFGKLWMRFTADGVEPRRWVKNFRWHAKRARDEQCCWLAAGLENLATKQFTETRGRKQLVMSKDKRDKRLCILRKRARLVQRLKFLMSAKPNNRDVDDIIKAGSRLEGLKEQIAPYGGAPPSWR